jgi:hypothetical protein
MALVHLYVQGYDGENLSNFELSLTVPSVIYEQEKVALWKEKIDLAKSMQDTNLIPSTNFNNYICCFKGNPTSFLNLYLNRFSNLQIL